MKITVSKTAPWTVSVDGVAHTTYLTRTAARLAAKNCNFEPAPIAGKTTRSQRAAKLGVSVYRLDRMEAESA